jgi:hypothetical protein
LLDRNNIYIYIYRIKKIVVQIINPMTFTFESWPNNSYMINVVDGGNKMLTQASA